jgi:hypothetical protein
MRVKYAVTFEFDLRPPLTYKGIVEAGQPHVCCARAVKEAKAALRPINWSSMVCVLLERLDGAEDESEAEEREAELEGEAV